MALLAYRDWLRVHEFLLDLHAAPALAALPSRILSSLRRVVSFDTASLQDDRGGIRCLPWRYENEPWEPARQDQDTGVRMMTHWNPEFGSMREAFFAASADKHPHTAYYRRTGDGSARRLSEVVSMSALRRTTFYNEISRKNRLRWQLTIYLPLPTKGTLTLAACREGTLDFSERDRLLLDLLRPHVGQAWRRALAAHDQLAASCSRTTPTRDARHLCVLGLTLREAEVLWWVAQGKTNAEIGLILGLASGTVKCHVERILDKLGCPTRTAAARQALEALAS